MSAPRNVPMPKRRKKLRRISLSQDEAKVHLAFNELAKRGIEPTGWAVVNHTGLPTKIVQAAIARLIALGLLKRTKSVTFN